MRRGGPAFSVQAMLFVEPGATTQPAGRTTFAPDTETIMKAFLPRGGAVLGACLVAVVSAAHAAEPAVVETGDSQKTCAVLTEEINALSASEAKAARRAESGRKFLGFAGAALQAAAPLLSSGKLGGGQGGYAAQQALGAFQQQAMQQQQQQAQVQMQHQLAQAYGAMPGMAAASEPPRSEPTPVTPGAQRLAHLKGLFADKSC